MPRCNAFQSNPSAISRRIRAAGATIALSSLALGQTGCEADVAWSEFRQASFSAFQVGLGSFFDGVVDGLGAIYQMGDGQEAPGETPAAE